MALTEEQSKSMFVMSVVGCIICLIIILLTGTWTTFVMLTFFFALRFLGRVFYPETLRMQYLYFRDKNEKLNNQL